jgi:hypothetical protein
MPDPIQDAIDKMSVLVVPTADGTGNPTLQQPLYGNIQTFTGAIFHISSDLTKVSKDVNTALTDAAGVVGKIGSTIQSAGSLANIQGAMTALQNLLSLAQSMAPSGVAVVLTSASQLFQQLQDQLTALAAQPGKTIADAATELAQLAQLLTALSDLFPTA